LWTFLPGLGLSCNPDLQLLSSFRGMKRHAQLAYILWPLWRMLLWTFMYRFLYRDFNFSWVKT
jgi:hypothetical protein